MMESHKNEFFESDTELQPSRVWLQLDVIKGSKNTSGGFAVHKLGLPSIVCIFVKGIRNYSYVTLHTLLKRKLSFSLSVCSVLPSTGSVHLSIVSQPS